jgi:L-lactate dehydrogenase (cytochrome)
MCDYYQVQADILVLAEEITNSMRNCGVTKIADLKPEMVGPAGPWVGQNKPAWK